MPLFAKETYRDSSFLCGSCRQALVFWHNGRKVVRHVHRDTRSRHCTTGGATTADRPLINPLNKTEV